ncbi:MAG: hypothetical protein KAG89_12255 [Fulvimarina manganoxydans]|uniref:hypothetical protein n=1 Tax=Fulvimarina manganoxydans TaxID=937218 RepID=UPI00235611AD|nr:hypothetical protein [Fulvimarina manganoxydans]MCK5932931.1 hypothetical protein [Fulvimarina manganoxydans]
MNPRHADYDAGYNLAKTIAYQKISVKPASNNQWLMAALSKIAGRFLTAENIKAVRAGTPNGFKHCELKNSFERYYRGRQFPASGRAA